MIRLRSLHSIPRANKNHHGESDILKLIKAFVSAQASAQEIPAY